MLAHIPGVQPGSGTHGMSSMGFADPIEPAPHRQISSSGAGTPPDSGTSAVEYAFLIAGILAVLVALGFAVLHVVQDGLPASCESGTSTTAQADC